jgi:biotin operon repressor
MKRKMVQVEEAWMSGEELAEALDISPARVSQLAAQGVFEQRTKDGYELNFSLRNYERYILAPRLYD